MKHHYDSIGRHYSHTRKADARIEYQIIKALGSYDSVVNIGAGTGSYEPDDRLVLAIEPSMTMIQQRSSGSSLVIQGAAENLPLVHKAVDVALAILTIHHWTDLQRCFSEMRRVARSRIVIFTWDQAIWETFWLVADYFPVIRDLDRKRAVAIAEIASVFPGAQSISVPISYDCVDGFHGAFWRRPEAYLDPQIRAGISTYSILPQDEIDKGLRHLSNDLDTGKWQEKYQHLLQLSELDLGYRLIVADM